MKTISKHGGRYYVIDENRQYPSVTTILSAMSDKSWLKDWEDRVGKEEADRLSKYAANRGSYMHLLCENYLDLKFKAKISNERTLLKETFRITNEDKEIQTFNSDALKAGKQLFINFFRSGYFSDLSDVVIQEVALYSSIGGGYAGRVDLIAVDNDFILTTIDFKSSNKPKRISYIDSYFMQISAYSFAYYQMFNKMPKKGEVWISNEDIEVPQKFTLSLNEMKSWYKKFIELVKEYHKTYN